MLGVMASVGAQTRRTTMATMLRGRSTRWRLRWPMSLRKRGEDDRSLTTHSARWDGRRRAGIRHGLRRRFASNGAGPDSGTDAAASLTLSQRSKALFQRYGWSAVAVYIAFSAIDLSICFVGVRMLGAETVRQAEEWVWQGLGLDKLVEKWRERQASSSSSSSSEQEEDIEARLKAKELKLSSIGISKEAANKHDQARPASLWTTFLIAYGIHKSLLLPIRVGLTAMTTPAIVKRLQKMGYNVGHGKPPVKAGVLALAWTLETPKGDSRPAERRGQVLRDRLDRESRRQRV